MAQWTEPDPIVDGQPIDKTLLESMSNSIRTLQTQVPSIFMDSISTAAVDQYGFLKTHASATPKIVSGIEALESGTTDANGMLVVPVSFATSFQAVPIITHSLWLGGFKDESGEPVMSGIITASKTGFRVKLRQITKENEKVKLNVGAILYHAIGW